MLRDVCSDRYVHADVCGTPVYMYCMLDRNIVRVHAEELTSGAFDWNGRQGTQSWEYLSPSTKGFAAQLDHVHNLVRKIPM